MRIPERSLQRKSGARERSHKRQAHMTDLENIIDTVKDGVLLQTQTYDLIKYLRLTGGIAEAALKVRDAQKRYFKDRTQSEPCLQQGGREGLGQSAEGVSGMTKRKPQQWKGFAMVDVGGIVFFHKTKKAAKSQSEFRNNFGGTSKVIRVIITEVKP